MNLLALKAGKRMLTGEAPLAVSVEEAARLAGLGRSRMFEEIASGRLPSFKVGRRRLIARRELESYIARLAAGGDLA